MVCCCRWCVVLVSPLPTLGPTGRRRSFIYWTSYRPNGTQHFFLLSTSVDGGHPSWPTERRFMFLFIFCLPPPSAFRRVKMRPRSAQHIGPFDCCDVRQDERDLLSAILRRNEWIFDEHAERVYPICGEGGACFHSVGVVRLTHWHPQPKSCFHLRIWNSNNCLFWLFVCYVRPKLSCFTRARNKMAARKGERMLTAYCCSRSRCCWQWWRENWKIRRTRTMALVSACVNSCSVWSRNKEEERGPHRRGRFLFDHQGAPFLSPPRPVNDFQHSQTLCRWEEKKNRHKSQVGRRVTRSHLPSEKKKQTSEIRQRRISSWSRRLF